MDLYNNNIIDTLLNGLFATGFIDDDEAAQKIILSALKKNPALRKKTSSEDKYNIMHVLALYSTNTESLLTSLQSETFRQILPELLNLLDKKDSSGNTPIELAQKEGKTSFARDFNGLVPQTDLTNEPSKCCTIF